MYLFACFNEICLFQQCLQLTDKQKKNCAHSKMLMSLPQVTNVIQTICSHKENTLKVQMQFLQNLEIDTFFSQVPSHLFLEDFIK